MNPNRDAILARLAGSSLPVSGDVLAHELGLSRAGIWKHIQSMRKQGIRIESYTGRGYQLKSDVLSPAMLQDQLGETLIGSECMVFDEIDSTNREAMRQAEAGADEGLVIIANRQTSGRGRLGRSWYTAEHDSLALSILLRPDIGPEKVAQLSLLTAVALFRALSEFVPGLGIKWPNDIMYNGAKIAGILTEMRGEPGQVHAVVIGIGINVRRPAGGWPEEITRKVSDLSTASGRDLSRLDTALAIIRAMERGYREYSTSGFAPIREAWWRAHAASGQRVRAHGSNGYVEGIAEALDNDGALLLRTGGKLQRFIAGDIELMDVN
ncbi:MAG: biotin--[acetyl-CoA-carboxylase] ligase [Mariprofundaceae bacterium]|nr:biotin--[acetyl-CoA-carboxylase] ligase [Mariprofundaceae bacterium]